MATEYPGNVIPSPGYKVGDVTVDGELLASAVGYTQWGVTLAGGQGVLPLGTLLARKTSDKKWYKYDNAGSGGVEVVRGILRQSVDTGASGATTDFQANIVTMGVVKNSLVSAANASAAITAAVTTLAARRDTVLDTFHF